MGVRISFPKSLMRDMQRALGFVQGRLYLVDRKRVGLKLRSVNEYTSFLLCRGLIPSIAPDAAFLKKKKGTHPPDLYHHATCSTPA